MATEDTDADSRVSSVRRRMLGALGAAGITTLAGCPGGGGNGTAGGNGNQGGGGTQTQAQEQTATPAEVEQIVEGGTLNVGYGQTPKSFDPPFSSSVADSVVQNFFWESLVTSDKRGNLYPWLAKNYELVEVQDIDRTAYAPYMKEVPVATTEDGTPFVDTDAQIVVQHPDDAVKKGNQVRVLTPPEASAAAADGTFGMQFQYNLHEGITFTNGEELTSQNVVDSYKRYRNSQVSAQVFNTFLTAEAVDDYTVNLYGQVPDAEGARSLPQFVFASEQIGLPDGNLDPRQGNPPIGTGPWEFESFEPGSAFVVNKRDDYWLQEVGLDSKPWWDGPDEFPEAPVIDKVNMRFISSNSQRAAALQEGEIDISNGLNADAQTNFSQAEGFKTKATETGGYLFMQYPVQVSPWDNKKVRQAANHLIPRKRVVENIEQGWSRPAWTPLPKLAYGSGTTDPEALRNDLKPLNEYRPERARELINEAGVETPISVQIETNSDNQNRVQKTQAIAQAMNATDLFDVKVETFEFGDLVGRILSPDYYKKGNIVVIGLAGTFNPGSYADATHDPDNFAQCCNFQKISNEELDKMMENARFSPAVVGNPQERAQRYDEVWRKVVDLSANSYIDIGLTVAVHNNAIKAWDTFPFPQSLYSYGLHAPQDKQITYINRES